MQCSSKADTASRDLTSAIHLHRSRVHTAAGASPPQGSIAPSPGCQSHRRQPMGMQKCMQVMNQTAPFRHGEAERPRSLKLSACPAFPSLQPLQPEQQSPAQQQVQGKQSQPRAAGHPAGPHSVAAPACSRCAKARAASRSGSEANKKQPSSPQLRPGDTDTVTVPPRLSPSVTHLLPCVTGELPMEKNGAKNHREQLSVGP